MRHILSIAADILVTAIGVVLFIVICSGAIRTILSLIIWGSLTFCYLGLLDRLYNIFGENESPAALR